MRESFAPTRYWHTMDDGRVQCDMCPRACKLRDGQRGLCFVRANHEDKVVLTSYGRSSGFCIDLIEKNPPTIFYQADRFCLLGQLDAILPVNFVKTGISVNLVR